MFYGDREMALIVQKFGGSSMANIERMVRAAQIVKRMREQGHQVVVVVSAMYGETDRLIKLAHCASTKLCYREYDALLATGEQASAALMSMVLIANGCVARSYTATQVKILTNNQHSKASIIDIATSSLLADISADVIPVVAGFQGVTIDGDITTIGRGGSDVTAVMLAAALHADECQIFTDVDGVYTSDPRVVEDARRLSRISFAEMWCLAELGAKVLQKMAVKLADYYHVPLRVLSSFVDGPGTLITYDAAREQQVALLSGIAFDPRQAKLTICGLPKHNNGIFTILSAMAQAAIDVDMVVENIPARSQHLDFSFTVHRDDYDQALEISQFQGQKLACSQVIGDNGMAKLSLVGIGMKEHAALAAKIFQTLAMQGIDVHLITSSEVKVSTVIAEQQMEIGARLLHATFKLSFT